MSEAMTDAHILSNDFDALLVLSFGGPEANEEVVPFLENVTRGRGIPRERLEVVGEHYFHFGGKSPLNELNREIIANVEKELAARGRALPVYFGNRNWHPFATDALEEIVKAGHKKIAVFATSAWGGYSACRQYHEDISALTELADARVAAGEQAWQGLQFVKLPQFFAEPQFITDMTEEVSKALAQVPAELADATRVLFTAHSVPSAHDAVGGAEGDKFLYSRQVAFASQAVAALAGVESFDQVWQSRSGNPRTPWLEPDIVEHTERIVDEEGVRAIVVVPIGFISDHMEVVWDLDTELARAAEERDVFYVRSATVGPRQSFAQLVVDLIERVEREPEYIGAARQVAAAGPVGDITVQGCTTNGTPCAQGCCDIWSLRRG